MTKMQYGKDTTFLYECNVFNILKGLIVVWTICSKYFVSLFDAALFDQLWAATCTVFLRMKAATAFSAS